MDFLTPILTQTLPKFLEPAEVAKKLGQRFLEEFVSRSGSNTSDFAFDVLKRLAFQNTYKNENYPVKSPPGGVTHFVIRFDFDQSELPESGNRTALEIAEVATDNPQFIILLIGSADRSGEATGNVKLGFSRAQKLGKELQSLGVPGFKIFEVARSEEYLTIQTRDGLLEPENRRVDIIFL